MKTFTDNPGQIPKPFQREITITLLWLCSSFPQQNFDYQEMAEEAGSVAQVVERLPSKYEVLISQYHQKRKEKKSWLRRSSWTHLPTAPHGYTWKHKKQLIFLI
jgi:hypothetical protein